MKFKTLYDGEKAVVIDRNGKKTFHSGPRRVNIRFCGIKSSSCLKVLFKKIGLSLYGKV